MKISSALGAALLLGLGSAWADSPGEPGRGAGEPNPLNNVYFGEQHLHTSASPNPVFSGNGCGGLHAG